MFFLVILTLGGAIFLISYALIPAGQSKLKSWQKGKEKDVAKKLDDLFYDRGSKNIVQLYFILPPALGILGFILTKLWVVALLFAVGGLFVPNFILKMREKHRKAQFNGQILDAIMILSSSLKGGLSLLQALDVLQEEMPAPMSEEIGLVVRENKMGVTLEESLIHLDKRIKSDDLSLVINSVLVAREVGGDLTKVLSRLSTTIRDNRKLQDNIRTLTLQGRMQGIIMSFLPIGFVWWILTFNRHHFDIMLQNEVGRALLFVAAILQITGMLLIKKFSRIRI